MKLVTQAEFARLAGVNRSTVHRWIANGRIEADAHGLIDPEAAARMREATESPLPHHQARKAQFDAAKQPPSPAGRGQGEGTAYAAHSGLHDAGAYPSPTQGETTQQRATAPQPHGQSEAMPAADKIGVALKLETYKLQKAKAEQANLELDKAAGALVERAEVETVLADFGATLRALLESLPDRLAAGIARHRGDVNAIHAEIEGVATDLLTEMSEHMKRKMEATAA